MDDSDIIRQVIQAVDCLSDVPIEFAATDLDSDMHTPPRPLLEIYMIHRGGWSFVSRGAEVHMQAGDIMICNAHFGLQGLAPKAKHRYACVSLAINNIPQLHTFGSKSILVHHRLRDDMRNSVWQAFQANEQALRFPHAAFATQRRKMAYLSLLLAIGDGIAFTYHAGEDQPQTTHNGLAEYLMAWVNRQSLHQALSMDVLVTDLQLSERHINRVFSQAFSRTPRQQHMCIRLERARALLQHNGLSVKQAARSVGFTDALYFSRMFKKYFNVSPKSIIDASSI